MFATRIKRGRVNPPDKVAGRMRCNELGMRESEREREGERGSMRCWHAANKLRTKRGKIRGFQLHVPVVPQRRCPKIGLRVACVRWLFFFSSSSFAFSISRCARHLLPSTDGGGVHISGRFDGIELNIYRLVFGVARDLRQVIRR